MRVTWIVLAWLCVAAPVRAESIYPDYYSGAGGTPTAPTAPPPPAPSAPIPTATPPPSSATTDGSGGLGGIVAAEKVSSEWATASAEVQRCHSESSYSAFHNCTVYANCLQHACEAKGLTCRTIATYCTGRAYGHAQNMIRIDGKWHFADATAGTLYSAAFPDPASPTPSALCDATQEQLTPDGQCLCRVTQTSDTVQPINANPITACALSGRPDITDTLSCIYCCNSGLGKFYVDNDIDDAVRWKSACISACKNHYGEMDDGVGVATGKACAAGVGNYPWLPSYYTQCESCCLDKVVSGEITRDDLTSCKAVCHAEYD
jgi:hypothetical protein